MSDNTLKDFGIKFGKTLQKIKIDLPHIRVLIKHCPYIVSISGINISDLIASDLSLPKLIELRNIEGCDDRNNLKIFVEKYQNTIKVFDTAYNCENAFEILSHLSHLTKLENLSLFYIEYDENHIDISNGLKELAVNCKLKHLEIDFFFSSNYIQLLNAINCFTQLKSLRLLYTMFSINESVELIKNCKQLTHLAVGDRIDDAFFRDIDKHLPKLSVVEITTTDYEDNDYKVTDETLNYLANLKQLRVIKVFSEKPKYVTHNAICNVIEKCLHFRSFGFAECPQITSQTIQVLIDIAKSRPHINFNHRFDDCSVEDYTMISTSIENHGSPINMKLSYELKNE